METGYAGSNCERFKQRGNKMKVSAFFSGVFVGAFIGGFSAGLSIKHFEPKPAQQETFEFLSLAHGAAFDALRVNKTSGESWGLTSDGTWSKIVTNLGVTDADEWLKEQQEQGIIVNSNGLWVLKTNPATASVRN